MPDISIKPESDVVRWWYQLPLLLRFHVGFYDVFCPCNEGIEGESALEVFATWGDTNEKAVAVGRDAGG